MVPRTMLVVRLVLCCVAVHDIDNSSKATCVMGRTGLPRSRSDRQQALQNEKAAVKGGRSGFCHAIWGKFVCVSIFLYIYNM